MYVEMWMSWTWVESRKYPKKMSLIKRKTPEGYCQDTHLQSFQEVTNDLTPCVGHSHDVLLLPGVAGSHGLGGGLSDGSVDQEEVLRRGSLHIRILVVEVLHTLANRL